MKARIPKPTSPTTDCILVSFDYTNGADKSVLIVGRKTPKKDVEIVNAFQGKEAEELYNKLITKKGE